MDKIYIKVDKKTGMVYLENTVIGRDKENLQQELIFSFENGFILGSPRLEYKIGNNRYHIPMTREGESYTVPIKNVVTKEGKIEMQLVIVQAEQDEEIPVFKSNVFYVYCNKSINAQEEAPDDYEYWLDVIEEKLAEVDEVLEKVDKIDIDATKTGNTATVSITNKEGITKSVEIIDGENGQDGYSPTAIVSKSGNTSTITITDKNGTTTASVNDGINGIDGKDGADAKINGVNTLSIEAGENITLDQQGSTLTINATGGTSDYEDLINQPKVNNVTLKGNKSLNDLGIQPAGNYLTSETDPTVPNHVKNITQSNITSWNNKSDFSGNYNDLSNKPTIPTVPTKVSAFTNDVGYLTTHQDISGKENTSNKSDSYTISSSETYASTKALVDGLATKKNIETKTITENDIRWHNGWKDCYGTQLNLDVAGKGRMSITPLWIIEGTTLNVNTSFYTQANTESGTKAYVDIELYKPSDGNANAYGWVNKVRKYMDTQGNYTIDETGYYVISVFNCTASNNPLKDYGKPYTFSYTVEKDLEVNYVNTVDWKVKDIAFVINGNTQSSFSNGLNWVCRREIGQPYYLSISGAASEHDMGCYSYNTNDFSGTKSSASRQAIFVYNDEIWYFAPSLDGHVGIASVSKFKIYNNNWIEYVGHCWHNLGHMNSVGYEKSTDVFIWGNGSSSYSQEGEGYIINNFSNSKLATSYNDEIVLMSEMDVDTGSFPKATYGFKVNVIPFSASCNNNSAPYNLYVAMATNDGNTFRIGKITANSSNKYLWENCVWENAINVGDVTETTTESYEHCIQGMAVLNGHIIMGEGHTKPQIATIWNDTFATMRTSCLLQQFSDSSITCVAVFDNKLVYCSSYEWIFTDITSLNNGISENRINELIENSIGNAIGGSY